MQKNVMTVEGEAALRDELENLKKNDRPTVIAAIVKEGKISYQSPIARALISKEIGDVVVVKTPGGDVEYEIDDVVYSAT